jgi:serine/threonine-protein kinase
MHNPDGDEAREGQNQGLKPTPAVGAAADQPPAPSEKENDPSGPVPGGAGNGQGGGFTSLEDLSSGVTVNLSVRGRPARPAVAGYEILGELGRGGMGVVYKARHLELNRLVALKMVLAGPHAGPGQLARFRTEARAVARLQHPNIVQIYEIGEHQGLPYFSLELIEGGSLAEKIARQPQPAGDAARLVEALARAVGYAHECGIVHRDLKPANVLLASGGREPPVRDSEAEGPTGGSRPPLAAWVPKIADFGLAKLLEQEGDAGPTQTGAILGTPSYMAPEQAQGHGPAVGAAADQYALGAILYDLLTGRPPFQGTTLLETLEQVQTREPVPPSQLLDKVPADLETICLKCLQKDPRRRYPDVGALADDLRRFLDGKPILARPVGSAERVARWARRNPRVAGLLAAVATLLVALLAVSWYFTIRLSREKVAVLSAKAEADESARAATEQANLLAAEKQAVIAAKAEADDRARAAAEQANVAVEALGALVGKAQGLLEDVPGSAKPRQQLLQLALELFQKVERHHRPGLTDRSLAAAHSKLGEICLLNNKKDEALAHYEKCRELTEALYAAAPDNDLAMGNYAVALKNLADYSRDQEKDFTKARDLYQRALELQKKNLAVPPGQAVLTQGEKQLSLASTHDRLGALAYNQGDPDAAAKHFGKALALREEAGGKAPGGEVRKELAQSHFFLGAVHNRRGDRDGAVTHYEQCQALRRRLWEENRHSVKARSDLATVDAKLGELRLMRHDVAAAHRDYEENLTLCRELSALNPSDWKAQQRLSLALYMAAATAEDLRCPESKARFEECLRLRRAYAKANPADVNGQIELMLALARVGDHAEAVRIAEEEVRRRASNIPAAVVQIACGYALSLDAAESSEQKDAYAGKAVEALKQARALGFKDLNVIDTDPDLDPLRGLPEFKAFREEVSGNKGP